MPEELPSWPDGARCAVMLSFNVDGPASWIDGDPRVWNWPKTFSMGAYGPWRGLPRILAELKRRDLRGTFFVPGWVAEHWPDRFKQIVAGGHEVGHHGYLHENPHDTPLDEQRAIIERSQETFERLAGVRAVGHRAPGGELRAETGPLLLELGFSYSSTLHDDDRPYRWSIDGAPSDLVEIPPHAQLDDGPQFAFNFFPPAPKGQDRIASHETVFDIWREEFDGYHRFGLCYVLTLHPQFIGKPGRMQVLARLLDHIQSHEGVWFATGAEIADWAQSQDQVGGASGHGLSVR